MPLPSSDRQVRVARSRRVRLVPVEAKRDALLRAAIQVFARRGFFNAQVADVARVAGVAAGTVYLYFRGKEHLLTSIFDRTMRAAIDEGRAALAGLEDPVARLREIARLHLDRLGRDRDLAIVFQVELRQSTKYMERFSSTLLQEYLALIRDAIADGQSNGSLRPDVGATFAAKAFFGALDEMATNWILSRRRYSLVSEAGTVADLFINGVKAGNQPASRDREPDRHVQGSESSRDQASGPGEARASAPAPDRRSRHHRKR